MYILPPRQSGSNCRPAGTGAASWEEQPLVPTPRPSTPIFFPFYYSHFFSFLNVKYEVAQYCQLFSDEARKPAGSTHSFLLLGLLLHYFSSFQLTFTTAYVFYPFHKTVSCHLCHILRDYPVSNIINIFSTLLKSIFLDNLLLHLSHSHIFVPLVVMAGCPWPFPNCTGCALLPILHA